MRRVWQGSPNTDQRYRRFFSVINSHETLENYYRVNFILLNNAKWSLSDIEDCLVWEREVYVAMYQQYIEEENLRLQQQTQQ